MSGSPLFAGPPAEATLPVTAVPVTAVPVTAVPVTAVPVTAVPVTALPVIIYDGDCGFCQWSLVQGRRFLTAMPAAQALQNADLAELGLTMAQALTAVQFVAVDRTVTSGHRAVASVLMTQPRFGWRLLGSVLTVPPVSFLAALTYRWVAGHRHLLPGHTDACAVPAR